MEKSTPLEKDAPSLYVSKGMMPGDRVTIQASRTMAGGYTGVLEKLTLVEGIVAEVRMPNGMLLIVGVEYLKRCYGPGVACQCGSDVHNIEERP